MKRRKEDENEYEKGNNKVGGDIKVRGK